MDTSLASLISLYVFTTGRRLFCLQQVLKLAKEDDIGDLVTHVTAAIKHERTTLETEHRWASQPSTTSNPTVAQIDSKVDRVLTAIRDHALQQAEGADADDPIGKTATDFVSTVFPAGLQAVTNSTFVDELQQVDAIVAKLKGAQAGVVAELALGRLAARLDKLAGEYRAALETPVGAMLTFGEVRAARARGQEMLLETVAMIAGRYHSNSKADVAARNRLLVPILRQNEAIGRAVRTKRAVQDVNPDTGAETTPVNTAQPAQ